MSLAPNNHGDNELRSAKLPTFSFNQLSELLISRRGLSLYPEPTHCQLPRDVEDALLIVQQVLSEAPAQYYSSMADGISLSPGAGTLAVRQFCDELALALASLYFPTSQHTPITFCSEEVQEAFRVVHAHFERVAQSLQPDGYRRFSVVALRNSFADTWHVHDFLTYILYCGREVGTEVLAGPPEPKNLVLKESKNTWTRRSLDVLSVTDRAADATISDTKKGLILPPHVAHRALHSTSLEWKEKANLALVLMAFKE